MNISNTAAPAAAVPTAAAPSAASGASALGQATGNNDMDKEAFLQLLVTQLSNQDPMNPMKGQEFAAQLAQFSSVEQLTNVNKKLESQQQASDLLSQSVNSGVAADLLGKNVEAQGNRITWSGEGEAPMHFDLEAPADEATLTIRDAAGNAVATKSLDDLSAGAQETGWDGRDDRGSRLAPGSYSFDVQATDAEGNSVAAQTRLSGRVERVTFGAEGVMLQVGGTKLPMSAVESVKPASE